MARWPSREAFSDTNGLSLLKQETKSLIDKMIVHSLRHFFSLIDITMYVIIFYLCVWYRFFFWRGRSKSWVTICFFHLDWITYTNLLVISLFHVCTFREQLCRLPTCCWHQLIYSKVLFWTYPLSYISGVSDVVVLILMVKSTLVPHVPVEAHIKFSWKYNFL